MKCILLSTIIFLSTVMFAQQIRINRIEMMPNMPAPYEMRDWKAVAKGYDSLVFNLNLKGDYLPLIFINSNTINYPNHNSFGLHTVVGTPYTSNGEGINVLPAVIGASLTGIDKSSQNGYNWVLMCEEYFNRRPAENVYLNSPVTSSGNDWWYETMPNVFFYQLYSMYPNTGDFKNQFTTVADRWTQALAAMGASTTPWKAPYMDYRAFSLSTMTPRPQGVHEPEAAGAIAWILYNAFTQTGDKKYRIGAEWAMEFLNSLTSNPAYELQLSYGAYIAARMNAELRTAYDIEKIVNWCFDVGPLRSWGAIIGNWGGYDVSGLIGENSSNDYAFIMNNFEQAGALVPLVRYDKRFARAIGKWVLNIANSARLFYPKYLPAANQDSYSWAMKYDPESYIAHEAIRKNINGNSPFATGDAISGGWGQTTLSLYSSSHVGILGGIVDTTNVPMILKLDVLKTDYFHKEAYPTYLYFNPYNSAMSVDIDLGNGQHDVYDAVSNSFLLKGASGKSSIPIPADNAVLAVICPPGGTVTYDLDRMLINNVIVDYHFTSAAADYSPRIKSLSSDSVRVFRGSSVKVFCTSVDPDNDSLLFNWSAQKGEVTTGNPTAMWIAPKEAGTYWIYCTVSDAKGNRDSDSISIDVITRINLPPVIRFITANPGKLDLSALALLSCLASDPDNEPLTFSWTSAAGTLSGNGPSVSWKAPAAEGNYSVLCTVRDTSGGAAADSVIVEVRDFSKYPKGNLVAYYPFNGNTNDLSGNNLNGTMANVTVASDRFGVLGNALAFNGSSSLVQIPNNPLLNFQNAITINFWMVPGDLPGRESFPISHGSWQNRWKVSVIPQKYLRWTIKTSGGTKDLDSKVLLQRDSLYNITALYSGSDMELYINGQLNNFSKWSGTLFQTSYDLTIGQMLPGDLNYGFKGIMDDIRIYNYPLLPEEIEKLYSSQTSVKDKISQRPARYSLAQNYPNPFNPSTRIRYSVPEFTFVTIKVYDILGSEVALLVDENKLPGTYELEFSEKAANHLLSSGIYFYRIQTNSFTETKSMIFMK